MSSKSSTTTSSTRADVDFRMTRKIRFGQTDPAGIVYYPNYFDMFNELVEDWFADGLGMSFGDLHQTAKLGVPIVQVECQFKRPCRIGEALDLHLRVLMLGNSSMHLQIDGIVAQTMCISANMVLVFVDLSTCRPVAPPDELRTRIEGYVVPTVNETIQHPHFAWERNLRS